MKQWKEDFLTLWKNKWYKAVLIAAAVCSYGFLITHQTIGIDDTPFDYYFEEGLIAIVGRWVLFLLNKVLHIADFSPFMMDLAGVVLFMAAVTVFSTLLYSILGDKLPMWGYALFAGIFLSSPIISEVFTYYLHNGVAIGYLCSAVSLCFFRQGLLQWGKKCVKPFLGAAVFLWISIGCYESFMIVWLVGVFLLLLTERIADIRRKVFPALVAAGVVAVTGLVLRSLMIALVTGLFGLEYLQGEAVQRSVTEMLAWMFEPDARALFHMTLKRVFVMYGVFAYAYLPIAVFMFAVVVMLLFGLWKTIKNKDLWVLLLTLGCLLTPLLLVLIEGKVTLYRAAQFLPLICGYGVLLVIYAVRNFVLWLSGCERWKKRKLWCGCINGVTVVAFCVLLFNQCSDMNRWFYVDYLKYEDAINTMNQIAYELEREYDISKPVVFTGIYEVPKSNIEDAFVDYGSETFYKMKRLTDLVDEHLLEKYYRNYGVWVVQTPSLSVIDWGRYAFDTDEEMARFFAMHGHTIKPLLDTSLYEGAEVYSASLPKFPVKGSIVDMGDYIIVHL